MTLTDASGQPIPLQSSETAGCSLRRLQAGTYTVSVGGWAAGESASLSYQLMMELVGQQDNAPPLVDGPAPALQITLATAGALPGAMALASAGRPASDRGPSAPDSAVGGAVAVGRGTGRRIRRGIGADGVCGWRPHATTGGEPVLGPAGRCRLGISSQNEAVGGLAGLGMGPLGGVGGQPVRGVRDDPGRPERPSAPRRSSTQFAVSLVTLTQVISWDREGEGIERAEARSRQVDDGGSSAPPMRRTSRRSAVLGPPAAGRIERSRRGRARARGAPRPGARRRPRSGPSSSSTSAVRGAGRAADRCRNRPSGRRSRRPTTAPVDGTADRELVTRLVIAGAIVAAVFRGGRRFGA